jgi:hypothetical protein
MMTRTAKTNIALGLVGALTLATAAPTWAAPVPSSAAAVKTAAPIQATEAHYVRHWHHVRRGFGPGAAIGGLALGLAGAALGAPYYYGYPGYAYGPTYYYGPGFEPGPYAYGATWGY